MEFHVYTYASLLVVGILPTHNFIGKNNQPIVCTFKLFNSVKQIYSTIERKALATVLALHKFRHYFLGNRFVFYVDHIWL